MSDPDKKPRECPSGDALLLFECSSRSGDYFSERHHSQGDPRTTPQNTISPRALRMTIGGLDEELSDKGRALSIEAAENFLSELSIYDFVRYRLLARPLLAKGDLSEAVNLAQAVSANKVGALYAEVLETQDAVTLLSNSWAQVAREFSHSEQHPIELERTLMNGGTFADVTILISRRDRAKVATKFATYISNAEASAFPQHAAVVGALRDRVLKSSTFDPPQRVEDKSNDKQDPQGGMGRPKSLTNFWKPRRLVLASSMPKIVLAGGPPELEHEKSCTLKVDTKCARPELFERYEGLSL